MGQATGHFLPFRKSLENAKRLLPRPLRESATAASAGASETLAVNARPSPPAAGNPSQRPVRATSAGAAATTLAAFVLGQGAQEIQSAVAHDLAVLSRRSRWSDFASALAGGREAGVGLAFRSAAFRLSPWKANLVARMVRSLTLAEAKAQCRFSRKRAATRVGMLRRAAAAIAQRGLHRPAPATTTTKAAAAAAASAAGVDRRTGWRVEQCFVGKGRYLRRVKLHARDKAGLMHHPSAHVRAAGERADTQRRRLELARLAHMLRRHRLYVPLPQHKPLHLLHPVWSRKPYRYVDSPKWTDPSAVLTKRD
ncbi:hypothetical protein HK405_004142 [Cladochytrium tenue]|nr:hypothetical protein HK405_004142 [Cladochytrium tenue]